MDYHQHQILQTPIHELNLSPEFKEMARINGFKNLQEFTEYRIDDLRKYPRFDIRMVAEYLNFLMENGLGDLIDD